MLIKLRSISIVLGFLLACPAHADLYGYVDQQGIIHLANKKLSSDYQLFKKGFIASTAQTTTAGAALLPAMPQQNTSGIEDPALTLGPHRGSARWAALISKTASDFQLDPHLLHSIISVESGYNPDALSPKGAIGLMQVMPKTGQRFGVTNLSDPRQNLIAGARYLQTLQTQFSGNLPLVIAAYNAGEGAVQKYRNTIPPFNETRDYVSKVMATYKRNQAGTVLVHPNTMVQPSRRTVLILRGDSASTENW